MPEPADNVSDLQDKIHRMKLLSKAQTALLKAHLHGKLTSMNDIVLKAIGHLKETGKHAAACTALESDLSKLKIAELEVDVKSVQLMMQEELAQLRASVESKSANPPPPPPPPSGATPEQVTQFEKKILSLEAEIEALRRIAASPVVVAAPPVIDTSGIQETMRLLDTDNQSLRRLLKEAKEEITVLNAKIAEDAASKQSISTVSTAELDAAKQEISSLTRQLADVGAEKVAAVESAEAARKELSAVKLELETTTSKLNAASADLSSMNASSASAGAESVKLRAKIEELKAALEAAASEKEQIQKNLQKESNEKISKLTKKFEAEKEEIMEVVSQEVEVIEPNVILIMIDSIFTTYFVCKYPGS
jgi:DNA repair exonuclease SbcCD ATPase subunit